MVCWWLQEEREREISWTLPALFGSFCLDEVLAYMRSWYFTTGMLRAHDYAYLVRCCVHTHESFSLVVITRYFCLIGRSG